MRIVIRQVTGGILANANHTREISFDTDMLPGKTLEKAKTLLAMERVAQYAAYSRYDRGADRLQYRVEYPDRDPAEQFLLRESACEPEFLELLDELFESANSDGE